MHAEQLDAAWPGLRTKRSRALLNTGAPVKLVILRLAIDFAPRPQPLLPGSRRTASTTLRSSAAAAADGGRHRSMEGDDHDRADQEVCVKCSRADSEKSKRSMTNTAVLTALRRLSCTRSLPQASRCRLGQGARLLHRAGAQSAQRLHSFAISSKFNAFAHSMARGVEVAGIFVMVVGGLLATAIFIISGEADLTRLIVAIANTSVAQSCSDSNSS